MLVLRFLATVFLLLATIAFVNDVTPLLDGAGPFKATSLLAHWNALAPDTLEAVRTAVVEFSAPWVWYVAIAGLGWLPASVLFGALGLACGYLGRRRGSTKIFAN